MATLSLDSIREAADKQYGATIIDLGDETVELKNPLRLPKEARERLSALEKADEDADPLEYFGELYEVLGGKSAKTKLLKALGDDVPLHMTLVKSLSEGVELGEASPSQD